MSRLEQATLLVTMNTGGGKEESTSVLEKSEGMGVKSWKVQKYEPDERKDEERKTCTNCKELKVQLTGVHTCTTVSEQWHEQLYNTLHHQEV